MTKKPKIPKSLQRTSDQRFEAMQTPQPKASAKALFQSTPEELGRAAMKGAKRTREQPPRADRGRCEDSAGVFGG